MILNSMYKGNYTGQLLQKENNKKPKVELSNDCKLITIDNAVITEITTVHNLDFFVKKREKPFAIERNVSLVIDGLLKGR